MIRSTAAPASLPQTCSSPDGTDSSQPRVAERVRGAVRSLPAQQVSARHWPLVASLNAEWATLALQPAHDGNGASWGERAASLHGLDTLDDVLCALRAADRSQADAILHALLTLTAGGDELAGRTVLQAMLGRVVRSLRTARAHKISSPEAESLAAHWEMIRTYPLHRTSSVAANLALGALNLLVRSAPALPAYEAVNDPDQVDAVAAGDYAPCSLWAVTGQDQVDLDGIFPATRSPASEVLDALRWAQQNGALTNFEIELLVRVHLHDESATCLADAGTAMGMTYDATRQRYSRAVRKLAHAVQRSLTHPLAC